MDKRICRACNVEQPIENFYRNAKSTGGRLWQCKSCRRLTRVTRYAWVPTQEYRDRKRVNDNASVNRRRSADQLFNRKKKVRDKYGLSFAAYQQMLEQQHHRCAICRSPLDENGARRVKPCVDHCHATNRVRGLLCWSCNIALGFFRDNPEFLANAIKYLSPE